MLIGNNHIHYHNPSGKAISGAEEDLTDRDKMETKKRIIHSMEMRIEQRFSSLCQVWRCLLPPSSFCVQMALEGYLAKLRWLQAFRLAVQLIVMAKLSISPKAGCEMLLPSAVRYS